MKSVALAKKNNLHIPRESSLTPTTLLSLLSLRIVGSGYPLLCQGLNIKKKKKSLYTNLLTLQTTSVWDLAGESQPCVHFLGGQTEPGREYRAIAD